MSYHQFLNETGEYGSFEVFYADEGLVEDEGYEIGWYWQACLPGCLPDGNPCGPFNTKQEAINNARDW